MISEPVWALRAALLSLIATTSLGATAPPPAPTAAKPVATATPAAAPTPAAATGAAATTYVLDPAKSLLEFRFMQAGAENKGHFSRFTTTLTLSDANLAASKLDVTIDVSSLDTADKERDTTLRGVDLFNVAKFPKARFTATSLTRTGAGHYEAAGKLTIRDTTRDVRVPFTFEVKTEPGGAAGYMTGKATIKRLDFGVGQGEWKSTEGVANEVPVSFSLRLPAAKG
jgi:polyisoprenoid-binding protein YceI